MAPNGTPWRSWRVPLGHKSSLAHLDWHPDGRHLVSCSGGDVMVWDATTSKKLVHTAVKAELGYQACAAFEPTQGKLLAVSGHARIGLWKWQAESAPKKWAAQNFTEKIIWRPDGQHFICRCRHSREIPLWDRNLVKKSLCNVPKDYHAPSAAWHPNGSRLLLTGGVTETPTPAKNSNQNIRHQWIKGRHVAWSSDGKHFVVTANSARGQYPHLRLY